MASTINTNNTLTGAGYLKPFRIFLASPGDVPLERKLAREAIIHINGERRFRGRIDIEIIAWDQPGAAVAMEAGLTPQQAIAQGLPKPDDCDLVVVILWSRIGTPLPADFELKPDGTPYLSGTESVAVGGGMGICHPRRYENPTVLGGSSPRSRRCSLHLCQRVRSEQ